MNKVDANSNNQNRLRDDLIEIFSITTNDHKDRIATLDSKLKSVDKIVETMNSEIVDMKVKGFGNNSDAG